MTKQLHSRTLLIVAALCAACGDGAFDEYDDQTGDPASTGSWEAGSPGIPATPGGNTGGGSADAGASDAAPWDARFDAGNGGTGGGSFTDAGSSSGWDASASLDAGWNGGYDASTDAGGGDAWPADASADPNADAGRTDSGTPGGDASACTLTYDNFGQQFLTTYCVSCHGASSPRANVRLDSLAGITARKAQAKAAVLNGVMPQGFNRPSNADRQRFGEWLDCGPN